VKWLGLFMPLARLIILNNYLPDDLTPSMLGKRIKIIGGPLDGYEGALITTRGSKVKRLLVKLENYLTAGVEVSPEFIQVL